MAIYEFNEGGIKRLMKTTFAAHGIHERQDIQRLIRDQRVRIKTCTVRRLICSVDCSYL